MTLLVQAFCVSYSERKGRSAWQCTPIGQGGTQPATNQHRTRHAQDHRNGPARTLCKYVGKEQSKWYLTKERRHANDTTIPEHTGGEILWEGAGFVLPSRLTQRNRKYVRVWLPVDILKTLDIRKPI